MYIAVCVCIYGFRSICLLQPAGDATEDSLEYQEGDTESDIETETAGTCLKHGESLSQIKDAPSADSNVNPGN